MPKEIDYHNLTSTQFDYVLKILNTFSSAEELEKLTESEGVIDIGLVTAQNILNHRLEFGDFSKPEDLLKVSGIGERRYAHIIGGLLSPNVPSHKLTRPLRYLKSPEVDLFTTKKILFYLNRATNPEEIASKIELPWRDIGTVTASRLLEYRDSLGGFRSLEEIDQVPGIGPSRFTDIIIALKDDPIELPDLHVDQVSEIEAQLVLKKLNDFNSPEEIDHAISLPNRTDIGESLAQLLFESREGIGGFSSLQQILDIKGIGPSRFTDIVYGLLSDIDQIEIGSLLEDEEGETKEPNRSAATLRARVATVMRRYLTNDADGFSIVPALPVSEALSIIQEHAGPLEFEVLSNLINQAIELEGIRPDERVMDIVHFPQISALTVAPPQDLFDPASLPDIHPMTRWARTCGGMFLFPKGPMTVEVLKGGFWETTTTFNEPIAITPGIQGLSVRTVMTGPLAPVGVGEVVIPSKTAFRLKCKNGVKGQLLDTVSTLDNSLDRRPSVPFGWGYPNTDIWVNPVPNPPFNPMDPTPEDIYLPGEVVVAGERKGEQTDGDEEDKGRVLVGFYPRVAIAVWPRLPFPWGPYRWPWPLPWPPKPDDASSDDPGFGGGGIGIVNDPDAPIGITVKIKGCECIRRPEKKKYVGEPNPDGGSYKWSVDDDTIAEIEGPDDQQEVTLKAKDIGDVTLFLEYTLNGQKAFAAMGVQVIYHKFTPRNTPTGEIAAVPLFQPTPKVRVSQGNHPYKLEEVEASRSRAKFHVSFSGSLLDALVDIEAVEISTSSGFKQELSRSGNEYGKFDDEKFNA